MWKSCPMYTCMCLGVFKYITINEIKLYVHTLSMCVHMHHTDGAHIHILRFSLQPQKLCKSINWCIQKLPVLTNQNQMYTNTLAALNKKRNVTFAYKVQPVCIQVVQMFFTNSVTWQEIKSHYLMLLSQGKNYMSVESYPWVSPALWMLLATPAGPAAHTISNHVILFGG